MFMTLVLFEVLVQRVQHLHKVVDRRHVTFALALALPMLLPSFIDWESLILNTSSSRKWYAASAIVCEWWCALLWQISNIDPF